MLDKKLLQTVVNFNGHVLALNMNNVKVFKSLYLNTRQRLEKAENLKQFVRLSNVCVGGGGV